MNTLVFEAPIISHIILPGQAFFNNLFFMCVFKTTDFSWYNSGMDKKALLKHLRHETVVIWDSLCEIYTPLVHYNEPKIELNPYFWRCAGCCVQGENRIQMATKFFLAKTEYFNYMMDVILPHEVIHQADWNLYGESEKICGHGENWQKIMLEYGLPADSYHTMEILRK
jgi:hypothetical protein